MNTIFTIARLTFREAIRRKIVLAALVLGAAFLLLYDVGFYFIQEEFTREITQGSSSTFFRNQALNFFFLAGMYVVNFLAIAIAALISADSLAGEIQSGTIQAVISKPIRRSDVVLGKWLGHAGLLLFYLLLMGGGVSLSIWLISGYQATGWIIGLGLIYFNSLIILSLTLALSSSLSTLATGGAVFGAYGLAFLGGWVERIGTMLGNQTAIELGIFSSLLLPSEAVWNKASTLMVSPLINMTGMSPFTSGSEPSTQMMIYAALYLIAALGLAIRLFGNRDL
jgi:Cu-processing system permease protein